MNRAAAAAALFVGLSVVPGGAQVVGHATLGVSMSSLQLVARGYRASKIIGSSVYDTSRHKIGNVNDLVITPDKKVSFAIVGVGGFLGIGQKDVAIPIDRFTRMQPMTLPGATKKALNDLPAFHYSH
ncbi:MAG: PRC-barrel domain-containing protein [Candidatus Eremiobacteraeota bacterium]|nr:PRC-barrel domain-containing protein [Candidatus Eremiobacteraeota bacterium]